MQSQLKGQLMSDPLQFGLKSKSSCSHAIFTFKTVVDHYISNGSTVTICTLNISKAFDKVDHYKLLNVLMDRLLPRQFIVLVHEWFAKCVACVSNWSWSETRWHSLADIVCSLYGSSNNTVETSWTWLQFTW